MGMIHFRLGRYVAVALMGLLGSACVATGTYPETEETRTSAVTVAQISASELEAITLALSDAAEYEMEVHAVDGLSIALVANGEPAWAQGFGSADRQAGMAASGDTIYRMGSISKLFVGMTITLLAEEGRLDLDAPVSDYLPDFSPENPYSTKVTVRHLITHRSGIVREPPVGHYFDASEASLDETVASLNATRIQFEPGTRYKYSNAALAVAGDLIEAVTGEPFDAVIETRIFSPLGMTSSAFYPSADLEARMAKGIMTSYDDPRTYAPRYNLGEAPAGNLFSSVEDLAIFLSALDRVAAGEDAVGPISGDLLSEMWTPQGTTADARMFGLSFILDDVSGARRVGHSGAVYGFVADARSAPDLGIGVAMAANLDQYAVWKLSDYAMALLVAAAEDQPLPAYAKSSPPSAELIAEVEGPYRGQDTLLILRDHLSLEGEHRLFVEGGETIGELRRIDDEWVYEQGTSIEPVSFNGAQMRIGAQTYEHTVLAKPDPVDPDFAGLVGAYGWDHDYIRVYEWNGRPHVRIEWRHYHEMIPVSDDVFAFPDSGFYPNEQIRFIRDETGKGIAVSLNGITFTRRDFGGEFETYLQSIMRPSETLVEEAHAAEPPREEGDFRTPDLVDLRTVDPTIKPALAYMTSQNLFGFPTYASDARPLMQRPAAEALGQVSDDLREQGYGLMVHDAYRPWFVTKVFWDATPAEGKHYVADPTQGSRHNRGCAGDLTLYDLETGERVEMAAGLDEVSMRSHFAFIGGTDLQRWHRDLLYNTMIANGFVVYPAEWWHFDYKDWSRYPVMNAEFSDIE